MVKAMEERDTRKHIIRNPSRGVRWYRSNPMTGRWTRLCQETVSSGCGEPEVTRKLGLESPCNDERPPPLQMVYGHKVRRRGIALRGYQLCATRLLLDSRVVCPNATTDARISDGSASFATLIPSSSRPRRCLRWVLQRSSKRTIAVMLLP